VNPLRSASVGTDLIFPLLSIETTLLLAIDHNTPLARPTHLALSLAMKPQVSDPPEFHCVVDRKRHVIEFFQTKKEARIFEEGWVTVMRKPAFTVTLNYQPKLGEHIPA
jgi:hypothetical protein